MPKIVVNEKDISWYYRQRVSGQVAILMPILASFGPTTPILVDDSNFVKVFGEKSVLSDDISYDMAYSFVRTGHDVLAWRVLPKEAGVAEIIKKQDADGNYQPIEDHSTLASVTAKYAGSMGAEFEVVVRKAGINYGISVIHNGVTIESLVYNFSDKSNEYYYDIVNMSSVYIEVAPKEGYEPGGDIDPIDVGRFLLGAYKPEQEAQGEEGSEDYVPAEEAEILNSWTLDGVLDNDGKQIFKIQDAIDILLGKGSEEEKKEADAMWAELADPLRYDFDVAVRSFYSEEDFYETTEDEETGTEDKSLKFSDLDAKFVELVTKKGSAIYLVDGLPTMSPEEFFFYTGLPDNDSLKGFDTSYAAAYGPWCYAQLVSNGVVRELPPSYVFLISWGQSLAGGNPKWMAPAGVKRASVGNIVRNTLYNAGSAIIESWQNQDNILDMSRTHKVNPITYLRQYGYVIYGNSTLLKTKTDGSTSMLQSFSTRILANMIKMSAFNLCLYLQFDQIDDQVFNQFNMLMGDYMDQLKYGGALYDYLIVADKSLMTLDDYNSRTIPIRIMISPNPAVENFIINLEISQAGVSFGDETITATEEI